MGLLKKTGIYGDYYGNDYGSSEPLNQEQMNVNATYLYKSLTAKGWSINAIAGILANIQAESTINPGRWQSDNVGVGPAYGLVQWDPYTKYVEWARSEGYGDLAGIDAQINRIIYEKDNNIQYYATPGYPESFSEFTTSTETPYYLACAFAWNYERSYVVLYGSEEEKEALRQKRGGMADDWYRYLSGQEPPGPDEPDEPDEPGPGPSTSKKKKGYNFILFGRNKKYG